MGFGGVFVRAVAHPIAASRRVLALPFLHPRASLFDPSMISGGGVTVSRSVDIRSPWLVFTANLNSSTFSHLVDTRLPKRRPGATPRKKRASLKPKGPFAWIQSVPGEPVPTSQPNEGSVKARGRNRKKRIQQRKAFIAAEVKKRKAAFSEHKRKKEIERKERKMAAVAREKAWAERLIELEQLKEAKKMAHTS